MNFKIILVPRLEDAGINFQIHSLLNPPLLTGCGAEAPIPNRFGLSADFGAAERQFHVLHAIVILAFKSQRECSTRIDNMTHFHVHIVDFGLAVGLELDITAAQDDRIRQVLDHRDQVVSSAGLPHLDGPLPDLVASILKLNGPGRPLPAQRLDGLIQFDEHLQLARRKTLHRVGRAALLPRR